MEDIQRKNGENIKKYKIRLCQNKELYNLNWEQIAEVINKETGDKFTSDKYRKWWYSYSEGYTDAINDNVDEKVAKQIESQRIELQKEKIRFKDQKREYDKAVKNVARAEHIIDEIHSIVDEIKKIRPLHIEKYNNDQYNDNEGLLLLADFHKGMFSQSYWNEYNDDEFYRRICLLTSKVIQYGKEHKIKTLNVMNLGDMINGIIHINSKITNTENVIKQTEIVAEVLSDMMVKFANEFNEIKYYSVVGNHARVNPLLEESIDEENFEYIIKWYMSARLANINNIKIMDNKYDDEIIVANICENNIFGVHGNRDKMNNVVQNLTLMLKIIPQYVVMAHMHHHQEDTINGVEVIMPDSFCGVDTYAKNLRRTSFAGQTFMVFNKNGRECTYNIKLNK